VKLTLVRHATLLVELDGRRVLVDPMLGTAGSAPPIEDTPNQVANPLVELPFPAAEVVSGVDLCLVTHLHEDHFDDAAAALLPRDTPLLTQPECASELRGQGFTAVTTEHPGWTMTRGRHGTGAIGEEMGAVSGWVLDGLYVAGDTVWCEEVRTALDRHRPRIVVVNAGGARFLEGDPITMTADDVRRVREATDAVIVVCHLEAINHCVEPRSAYGGIPDVLVPADGETLIL